MKDMFIKDLLRSNRRKKSKIDYIDITTIGAAVDFGDLIISSYRNCATSDAV